MMAMSVAMHCLLLRDVEYTMPRSIVQARALITRLAVRYTVLPRAAAAA